MKNITAGKKAVSKSDLINDEIVAIVDKLLG